MHENRGGPFYWNFERTDMTSHIQVILACQPESAPMREEVSDGTDPLMLPGLQLGIVAPCQSVHFSYFTQRTKVPCKSPRRFP